MFNQVCWCLITARKNQNKEEVTFPPPPLQIDELQLDREGAGKEDRQLHEERGLGGQDQQAENTGTKRHSMVVGMLYKLQKPNQQLRTTFDYLFSLSLYLFSIIYLCNFSFLYFFQPFLFLSAFLSQL